MTGNNFIPAVFSSIFFLGLSEGHDMFELKMEFRGFMIDLTMSCTIIMAQNEERWKTNTAFSYLMLIHLMAEGVSVVPGVSMWLQRKMKVKEMKADLGSGAASPSDLDKAQIGKFPQKVTPPKWAARHEYRVSNWEEREENSPTHSYLINTSAEMLVVMEMVSQHVITMYKNSNMGALCVGERVKALWRSSRSIMFFFDGGMEWWTTLDGIWKIWSPSSSHSPRWLHISHIANAVRGNVAPRFRSLSLRDALLDKLLTHFGDDLKIFLVWKGFTYSTCDTTWAWTPTFFIIFLLLLLLTEHTIFCRSEEHTGYFIH